MDADEEIIKSKIRQMALKLAIGDLSQTSSGRETSIGEFNIDFSLMEEVFGKVHIRISRIDGGYVSVLHARLVGKESQYLWSYRFFDEEGHLTKRNRFIEK